MVHPSLSFYAVDVYSISGESGLIQSSQFVLKYIRIVRPALRIARLRNMLLHLTTLSLCLLAVDDCGLVFIGIVQTVSTAHSNFCHIVGNKHCHPLALF